MFTKQNDIDNYITDNGFFLSEDKLYMKTGSFEWVCIDDRREGIIRWIKDHTSPITLPELSITFPSISLSVFGNFEKREESIAAHIGLLDEITESQKKFLNNKDWRLIEVEKVHRKDNNPVKYLIYDITKKDYNPIKESFLKDKDLKSAFKVKNIVILEKLANENFENRYEKAYEIEMERFNQLKINEVYNQNDK